MTGRALACAALVAASLACSSAYEGGGELRARKKELEREVAGLRDAIGRLERKEPMLPASDLAVGIDEALLQGVIAAQMPFVSRVREFELTLEQVEVTFRGAPSLRLRGRLRRVGGRLDLEAVVNVQGALDNIAVDGGRGALAAKIVVDHIGIEKAAGIESLLSGATLDELARTIRVQLADELPPIQIPVKVQQSIELPALTSGPVRVDGASMPIAANVSQVFAGQGRLWVAIHFEPGALAKTSDAPEAQDTDAADVDTGFDEPAPQRQKPQAKGPRP
jgi:hypothetical protein